MHIYLGEICVKIIFVLLYLRCFKAEKQEWFRVLSYPVTLPEHFCFYDKAYISFESNEFFVRTFIPAHFPQISSRNKMSSSVYLLNKTSIAGIQFYIKASSTASPVLPSSYLYLMSVCTGRSVLGAITNILGNY